MIYLSKTFFLVTFTALLTQISPSMGQNNELGHIGIIGGGAAGLTSAYLLQQKGYRVTVIEKDSSVGGVATTKFVRGKAYDMSTIFIPGGSLLCTDTSDAQDGCIEPTLKELIDVSNEKISLTPVGFSTLDTTINQFEVVPEPLQEYDPEAEIIPQLLQGLVFSLELLQCIGSQNYALYDVCADANMGIFEWGRKWSVPAYVKLITYVFDGLGAGPSAFGETFLSTLSTFAAVDVAEVLRNLGVTSTDLASQGYPNNIVSLLTKPRWYVFENGFQTFWQKLVQKAELQVVLSAPVSSIKFNSDQQKWTVNIEDGDSFEFDQVIVATPPLSAIDFLPDGDQKDLIILGAYEGPSNNVILARVDDSNLFLPSEFKYGDREPIAFWPTGFGQGTVDIVNPSLGGTTKPIFWIKRHGNNRDLYLIGTYELSSSKSDEESIIDITTYGSNVLGVDIQEVLYFEKYFFPDAPKIEFRQEWSQRWATLQGVDGLWFNGEAFAGSGVPSITQYTKIFVNANF